MYTSSNRWLSRRWWLPLILLVSYAVLNAGGWWFYHGAEETLTNAVGGRLLVESELVAGQIDGGLVEQTTDSVFDAEAYLDLYDIVTAAAERGRFANLFLLGPDGRDWLEPDDDSVATERALFVATASEAFTSAVAGSAAVSQLYRSRGDYFLAACVPVMDTSEAVLAVLAAEAGSDYFSALSELSTGLWVLDLFAGLVLLATGLVWGAAQRRLQRAEQAAIRSAQLAAMGQMVATVAHELKNPLGIIRNSAERIKSKYGREEEPLFDFIPEEVERLDQLLRRYLNFARLEVGAIEPVEAEKALERLEAFVPADDSGVTVSFDAGEAGAVAADPAALQQILHNLLLNAIEACRANDGGTVTVRAMRSGGAVTIEMADTGVGMDAETLRHAAEPFYTTRADGSGLGIYLAQTLTEKMQGKMQLNSRAGAGTTVRVVLPAAEGS